MKQPSRIPKVQKSFADANAKGVRAEWFASLVDSQLPSYCVEVLRDGTYKSLEEMLSAAHRLQETLEEMGIFVRHHGNDHDRDNVAKCQAALKDEFERTHSGRSNLAVERDAETMAMVWRRRRRQKGSEWPGGWIISSDRHIAPAYLAIAPKDPIPLTMSLAQWSTLLAATVAPAEVVELAAAAAEQLVEEAMWLLPSRFPSEVALDLAKQIGPAGGGSEIDLRYAQLTLDGSLDEAGMRRSATALAADVLAARTSRQKTIQELRLEEAQRAQSEAVQTAVRASEAAEREAEAAVKAKQEADTIRAENKSLSSELIWAKRRILRVAVSVTLALIALVVIAGTFLLGLSAWVLVAGLVALVTIGLGGYRWCTVRDARLLPVVIAAGVEAISVVTAAIDLLNR